MYVYVFVCASLLISLLLYLSSYKWKEGEKYKRTHTALHTLKYTYIRIISPKCKNEEVKNPR